jgi:hypothetical protein
MANKEFDKRPDEKQKRFLSMRGIMDYGMGILWCAMGTFLLFPEKFSRDFSQFNDPMIKGFAGICIFYGLFRIYRGYKKNYYNG